MKSTLSDQIREYCEEALRTADKHGVHEGLSYLIGNKFCRVHRSLQEAQNKTKFMYSDDIVHERDSALSDDELEVEISYSPAPNEKYLELQEEILELQSLRDEFVKEIKDCFELQNIEDYLNGYPRLDFHNEEEEPADSVLSSDTIRMDKSEIFSEVEDIFLIEEIKKLFI
ncbi:MAG: hypothetical protein ACQ9MH_12110 [Nitrospinales bacterium]